MPAHSCFSHYILGAAHDQTVQGSCVRGRAGGRADADGRARSDTAQKMRTATAAFIKTLDAAQRSQAAFTFESEERLNWHFVPRERKGLPVKAMTPAQRTALAALLHIGLSDKGYEKVDKIRSLENDLIVIEQGKGPLRDPDNYYLSVFGTPAADKPWGWRFEGHHVALNWTIIGGSAIASSPQFFGANPAEVRDGPHKGLRVLANEEDLARTFVTSLDAAESAEAVVSPEAPRDIITMNKLDIAPLDNNGGIVWTKLSASRQKLLTRLIEEHAFGQAASIGQARVEAIRKAGMDTVRFAWLGPTEKGAKHYLPPAGSDVPDRIRLRRATAITSTRSGATSRATSAATSSPNTTAATTSHPRSATSSAAPPGRSSGGECLAMRSVRRQAFAPIQPTPRPRSIRKATASWAKKNRRDSLPRPMLESDGVRGRASRSRDVSPPPSLDDRPSPSKNVLISAKSPDRHLLNHPTIDRPGRRVGHDPIRRIRRSTLARER